LRTAFAGAYDVTLKLSGYALVRQHLEVEDGKKASARLTLTLEGSAPVPPPPPPVAVVKPPPPPLPPPPLPIPERGPRPIWRVATGASLIGVGALLGAYGVSGLAVDGSVVDVNGSPMRLYSQAPGGAFLGVGLAVAIGGAVLLAVPGPRRPVHAARHGGSAGSRLSLSGIF
jgi:hypothetical protein